VWHALDKDDRQNLIVSSLRIVIVRALILKDDPPHMDKLRAIKFFCSVAEAKSFVAAAHNLDVRPSVLSKVIASLEREIDFRLFNRTTRRVSLTENGAQYYDRCKRLIAELEQAEVVTRDADARPVGRLLAGLHPAINRTLMCHIERFLAEFPDILVESTLSSTVATMIEDKLDVLITVGGQADASYGIQKIGMAEFVLVASPEYLRAHGQPSAPEELSGHRILMSARRDGPSYARWQLTRRSKTKTVFVVPRVVSREGVHMHEACLNAAGICRLLDFSVVEHLRRGHLQRVLPEWQVGMTPINALYPSRRQISARVHAFVGFVRSMMRDAKLD
jgi:LysR family transcriptional regulator for bpeEF and oprC